MTHSGMVERSEIYVLGPNQDGRLASVAAGAALAGLTVQLDSDAPFILRGRALRCAYDSSRYQTGLNHVLAKWAGPDRNFRQQDFVRQSLLAPYFGQLGSPIPVWPNVIYPKNGVITVDMKNESTGSTLTNLTFYFIGTKLFAPGSVKSSTYPAKLSTLPFTYEQRIPNLGVTSGPIRQSFLTPSNVTGIAPHPISDADFVIQSIQAGVPFFSTPVNEVFIRLYDEDEKPYSNDYVHIDVMAGNSCFQATYPAGTSAGVAPIGCGPNFPGVFYPEIYVQKNHIIYYQVSRTDIAYAGAATVGSYPINFGGVKVFEK